MPSTSPPEYFIDRSLGRNVVPDALRAAGAIVHVMADVYGERVGPGLPDTVTPTNGDAAAARTERGATSAFLAILPAARGP